MNKLKIFAVSALMLFVPSALSAHTSPEELAGYLRREAVSPVEYVLSKLKDYRIVAIGEDHWIADHTPFFCEVLKKASERKETRPDVVALEFGSESDQRTADRVAFSPEFLPDSVIKILQHAPDVYGNPYKEYFDVFRAIWEINRNLPDNEKIGIRLLDPAVVQNSFHRTSAQRGKDRDMTMFEKIRHDFVRGNKIVFYAGAAHTERQMRGYKPDGAYNWFNYPSAGFLLKSAYPDDVFTIDLWAPLNMGMGYKINPETGKWHEKNYGKFDQAFSRYGNRPCGFDIAGSPWGDITMTEYFSKPGQEDFYEEYPTDAKPYTGRITLSDLMDGIVFVKPSQEFKGGTLIDIYTPDFIEICRRRSGGRLSTPNEFLRQVREWHPLMTIQRRK